MGVFRRFGWTLIPVLVVAFAASAAAADKGDARAPRSVRDQIDSSGKVPTAAPQGVSDCCFGHGTPGCDDPTCEAAVCAIDSFCCAVAWDSICAGEALSLCAVCQGGVANDECDAAIPVAIPSTTSGNTALAGVDSTFPLCGGNFGANPTAPGIWYEVVGNGNVLQASLCNQADYDTQLTVYCQDCATPFCINGNDDATGCGVDSELTWESELNATYHVLVHGFGAATGPFDLTISDTGVASTNPAPCFGPLGACCDPTTGGCTQTDIYLCTLAGGSFGEGIPCAIPTGGVTSITSSPGVAIPDNDTIGVSDTVNVPGSFPVASASVDVGITHTWIGDLRIRLQNNQTGQIINMWDRRCGSTANINTTFIDGGPDTLCAVVSAGGGQVDPLNAGLGPAFSTLNGVSATGDWTLIVDDNFPADVGTLNTWTLNLVEGQSTCYAYPPVQEIPTMDRRGLAALALLLAGAAALLIWRRRG